MEAGVSDKESEASVLLMDERVKRVNRLLGKIRKGDEKALDSLFAEFGALFLNIAKKYLFEKSQAEDLLGEVFLDLVRNKARSFRTGFNGLNWMHTAIKNKAYRFNGGAPPTEEYDESKCAGCFVSDDEENLEIKEILSKLSEYENALVYCRYWEGLTVRETARKLGKPRSTVHGDEKRILGKLAKMLDGGDE